MDVQMPEMDGLEAARRIRAEWPEERQPRIVALTANAMREDREVCRAAGMDDYVAKPVRVKELQAALARCGEWRPMSVAPPPEDSVPAPAEAPLDPGSLAELRDLAAEGGPSLAELLALFRADVLPLLARIRATAHDGDAECRRRAAHALKGAAANLGARPLAALCLEMERLSPDAIEEVETLVNRIEAEFARACDALEDAAGAQA